MAKVVPAHEVGLPEGAGRVRVSTSRARRGKILAVEHPLFGWIPYQQWAALGWIQRQLDKVGIVNVVAWGGLTIFFKGVADSGADLLGVIQSLIPAEGGVPPAFGSLEGYIGAMKGALAFVPGVGQIFGLFFGGVGPETTGRDKSLSAEAIRWVMAAVTAAIVLAVGGSIIGKLI